MKIIRLLAIMFLFAGISSLSLTAQSSRQKGRKVAPKPTSETSQSVAKSAQQEVESEFDIFFSSLLKNAFVIFRQDYHLVDEDEGYIKMSEGKEYWGRTYALGARIGDSEFLFGGDALRPWFKEGLSKSGRFVPALSQSAVRSFEGLEFEPIEFDPDGATEIREKRLYSAGGSEEPGLSLVGMLGRSNGYAVWALPERPLVDGDDSGRIQLVFEPMTLNVIDGKSLYDCSSEGKEEAMGGFFLVPVKSRPGAVDFCIVGMIQKIGGIWKIVTVDDGTEIKSSVAITPSGDTLVMMMDGMEAGMEEFVSEIGL